MSSAGAALIANARSRRARKWFRPAQHELEENGIALAHLALVEKGRRLEQEVAQAVEEGCDPILIGGGDGTLRSAAQVLAGSGRTLGVLPFGTGNSFARDLGIRTSLAQAVQVIREGHIEEVDAARANGTVFLNLATLGFSAFVAQRLRATPKALLGPLAYLLPLFHALRRTKPFEARIETAHEIRTVRAFQVVAANGRLHAGPFPVSSDASVQSGRLQMYAVRASGRAALYRYLCALLLGNHEQLEEVLVWKTPWAKVETNPPRRVVLDGELMFETPLELEALPRAIRVLAPQNLGRGAS